LQKQWADKVIDENNSNLIIVGNFGKTEKPNIDKTLMYSFPLRGPPVVVDS
jgi:hypothetical protein